MNGNGRRATGHAVTTVVTESVTAEAAVVAAD
jgi:hypothetical protein